jgi:CheY-like chemotaxis protein
VSAEDTGDLDFTIPPPPPKRSGGVAPAPTPPPISTPPPPRPAKADDASQVSGDIGRAVPGKGANHIVYARGGVSRPAPSPDAPVLIVEDDPDTLRLLERALTLQGFTVRTAADGQQFVQAIRQRPLPCLVLLDVELPRISGFRILSFLRQEPQTSGIPVVMVTARSENKDLVQGITSGADGYLSKPVTFDALRAVVTKVLQR